MKETEEAKKKYEKILQFKDDRRALEALNKIKKAVTDEVVIIQFFYAQHMLL